MHPLEIAGYTSWTAFERATPEDREKAVIRSLDGMKHERTILSPAEALNVVTVGARHHDSVAIRQGAFNMIDPLQDEMLPNITSGLGLGYYFKPGTVIMARLDRGTARILPQPTMHTHAWSIGAERALTPLGNVVLRASYNQEHDGDPLALVGSTDKLFKLDFRFMW